MSMCVEWTRVSHHPELGLWVKHEEECCPPGPHFSKTRGVYAHIKNRPERIIGVLDTYHSQGGHAVAQACRLLGKQCVNFYPQRKSERDGPMKPQQVTANELGASMVPLQAGRSAILYHHAKKHLERFWPGSSYMMPNALKLPEMITETVAEVARTTVPDVFTVIVSASSGTIAAGVWRGLYEAGWSGTLVVHQGYSRSEKAIREYMTKMAFGERAPLDGEIQLKFVDEGYAYGDEAKPVVLPPFPSNKFYDLKAFQWWTEKGRGEDDGEEALLWNVG